MSDKDLIQRGDVEATIRASFTEDAAAFLIDRLTAAALPVFAMAHAPDTQGAREWMLPSDAKDLLLRAQQELQSLVEGLQHHTGLEAPEAEELVAEIDLFLQSDKSALPDLSDPVTVHANMLRGTIAKPSLEHIIHLYGVSALCWALVPEIMREGEGDVAAPERQSVLATREKFDADVGPRVQAEYEAAIREAALREAADLVLSTAYTSSGDSRHLAPVRSDMRGVDMHHATIAAAILALITAKGGE